MARKDVSIRPATPDDVAAITDIYNEAILNTVATFDTATKSVADRTRWFETHDARHPVIVAEVGGTVVAWATLSAWSDRQAYSGTAETTLYVDAGHRGGGIGGALLSALIDIARKQEFHTLIARITTGSEASIRLHVACGFEHVGTLREVGFKFDRYLDVEIYQKML